MHRRAARDRVACLRATHAVRGGDRDAVRAASPHRPGRRRSPSACGSQPTQPEVRYRFRSGRRSLCGAVGVVALVDRVRVLGEPRASPCDPTPLRRHLGRRQVNSTTYGSLTPARATVRVDCRASTRSPRATSASRCNRATRQFDGMALRVVPRCVADHADRAARTPAAERAGEIMLGVSTAAAARARTSARPIPVRFVNGSPHRRAASSASVRFPTLSDSLGLGTRRHDDRVDAPLDAPEGRAAAAGRHDAGALPPVGRHALAQTAGLGPARRRGRQLRGAPGAAAGRPRELRSRAEPAAHPRRRCSLYSPGSPSCTSSSRRSGGANATSQCCVRSASRPASFREPSPRSRPRSSRSRCVVGIPIGLVIGRVLWQRVHAQPRHRLRTGGAALGHRAASYPLRSCWPTPSH